MTALAVTPGSGASVFILPYIPLGYQQITSMAVSTALTVPATSTHALITVEVQGVRYRDDGTAPTVSVGMPLDPGGGSLLYQGGAAGLAALRFIAVTAGAILNVSYYK